MRRVTFAKTRRISDALLRTTRTMSDIASDNGCSVPTVRRIAVASPLHPSRQPVKRMTSRATVLAVAERLRTTRDPMETIAASHGLARDTVFRICIGKSRSSITGGPIHRPGPPDDTYDRSDWLSDLADVVRCVSDGSALPDTIAALLMAIDEVHLPPDAARLMGMTVDDWISALRVDMEEGGTHRREVLTPAQLSRSLEVARSILANGGMLPEAASQPLYGLAMSRPEDGTPV